MTRLASLVIVSPAGPRSTMCALPLPEPSRLLTASVPNRLVTKPGTYEKGFAIKTRKPWRSFLRGAKHCARGEDV